MRTPSGVAKQIRDVVPEEHKEAFASLINSFSYMAPELAQHCWMLLSGVCNALTPAGPVEDWQVEMIAILTDRRVDEPD